MTDDPKLDDTKPYFAGPHVFERPKRGMFLVTLTAAIEGGATTTQQWMEEREIDWPPTP